MRRRTRRRGRGSARDAGRGRPCGRAAARDVAAAGGHAEHADAVAARRCATTRSARGPGAASDSRSSGRRPCRTRRGISRARWIRRGARVRAAGPLGRGANVIGATPLGSVRRRRRGRALGRERRRRRHERTRPRSRRAGLASGGGTSGPCGLLRDRWGSAAVGPACCRWWARAGGGARRRRDRESRARDHPAPQRRRTRSSCRAGMRRGGTRSSCRAGSGAARAIGDRAHRVADRACDASARTGASSSWTARAPTARSPSTPD